MENRMSGVVVVLFGIILLVFIIPSQTEVVDSGWLKPATLPTIAAIIITVAGLLHSVFPRGGNEFDRNSSRRALLFFIIGVLGVWLMTVSYLVAAPLLVLALMLVIGERRWQWLLVGVVLMPVSVWFFIDYLLKRPLP
ncbi:tripartite tricarboxylate transporter TctB family protein [Desulforhopalus sp. 52FAK]